MHISQILFLGVTVSYIAVNAMNQVFLVFKAHHIFLLSSVCVVLYHCRCAKKPAVASPGATEDLENIQI